MNVALTGATGFIGSHVLTELQEHGHEVTALVREDARAEVVAARGALRNVVSQPGAHVMNLKVGERTHGCIAQ